MKTLVIYSHVDKDLRSSVLKKVVENINHHDSTIKTYEINETTCQDLKEVKELILKTEKNIIFAFSNLRFNLPWVMIKTLDDLPQPNVMEHLKTLNATYVVVFGSKQEQYKPGGDFNHSAYEQFTGLQSLLTSWSKHFLPPLALFNVNECNNDEIINQFASEVLKLTE